MLFRLGVCRALFILLATLGATVNAQLDVNLSVDVSEEAGLYTYVYTLENTIFSNRNVNTFLFTTADGAEIQGLAGPNENWFASYEKDLNPANLQGAFITGVSEDGVDCGVTSEFDIRPGSSAEFTMVSTWAPAKLENANPPLIIGFTQGAGIECAFVGNTYGVPIEVPAIRPDGPPPLTCDFDKDGDCDLVDIDNLNVTIVGGLNDPTYDLNNDNAVNNDDLDVFLEQVNRLNGDLDFNGEVAFQDFLVLSNNFGQAAEWSGGDLDSTGDVQFGDFLILSTNFGKSAEAALAATSPVPEPESMSLAALTLLGLLALRRRNRS